VIDTPLGVVEKPQVLGASANADRAGGPSDPSPSVSAKGAHPSREEQIHLLETALEEIAEWYSPEGMGTANELAGIALEALVDLDDLRRRDRDEHRNGEDPKGLSGEAMPARAEGIAHD